MAISTAARNALERTMHGIGNAEEVVTALNTSASIAGLTSTAAELNTLHGVVAGTAPVSGAVVLDANKHVDVVKTTTLSIGATGAEVAVTSTPAELNVLHSVAAGTVAASSGVVVGALKQVDTLAVGNLVSGVSATPGAANQSITVINKKTAIADNTPTSIFTVTCPNATHTAVVEIILLAAVNNAGALDSARVAVGYVVFDRVAGAALVATASALTNTGIATSGTATLTAAYSVAAVVGAVGATNTIDIQVTLVKTGGTNHQIVALATIINSEASGMTLTSD